MEYLTIEQIQAKIQAQIQQIYNIGSVKNTFAHLASKDPKFEDLNGLNWNAIISTINTNISTSGFKELAFFGFLPKMNVKFERLNGLDWNNLISRIESLTYQIKHNPSYKPNLQDITDTFSGIVKIISTRYKQDEFNIIEDRVLKCLKDNLDLISLNQNIPTNTINQLIDLELILILKKQRLDKILFESLCDKFGEYEVLSSKKQIEIIQNLKNKIGALSNNVIMEKPIIISKKGKVIKTTDISFTFKGREVWLEYDGPHHLGKDGLPTTKTLARNNMLNMLAKQRNAIFIVINQNEYTNTNLVDHRYKSLSKFIHKKIELYLEAENQEKAKQEYITQNKMQQLLAQAQMLQNKVLAQFQTQQAQSLAQVRAKQIPSPQTLVPSGRVITHPVPYTTSHINHASVDTTTPSVSNPFQQVLINLQNQVKLMPQAPVRMAMHPVSNCMSCSNHTPFRTVIHQVPVPNKAVILKNPREVTIFSAG